MPFLDERSKPYQYMAIRSDITERKRTEALLREQAALARLGEMAAVVAHEVKNPLAGIRGALQVIGGRMPETSRDRAVLGDIVDRIDSLNDIVQDLLVFARPRDPSLAPVALVNLLERRRRRSSGRSSALRDPSRYHWRPSVLSAPTRAAADRPA